MLQLSMCATGWHFKGGQLSRKEKGGSEIPKKVYSSKILGLELKFFDMLDQFGCVLSLDK